MGDRVTEGDNPIEYEETTETFEGGTRTTRTPRMSDSKDSQDVELSEGLPKTMAGAGPPPNTKRYVKSSTLESSQEEREDSRE